MMQKTTSCNEEHCKECQETEKDLLCFKHKFYLLNLVALIFNTKEIPIKWNGERGEEEEGDPYNKKKG